MAGRVAGSGGRDSGAGAAAASVDAAALLRLSADWIWASDAAGRIASVERLSGDDGNVPDDLIGRPLAEALNEGDDEALARALTRGGDFANVTCALPTERAGARWATLSAMARRAADGSFAGYVGTARNLASSFERFNLGDGGPAADAERLMLALNAMADGFCYYDSRGRLALYNDAFVAICEGLEDVIRRGAFFEDLLQTALDRGFWDLGDQPRETWRAAAFGTDNSSGQEILRTRTGRYIMRRQVRVEDGGRIAILTDVTDMKRGQAEMAAARERTSELLQDLQRTVDAMNVGVVVVDAELRVEIVNRAFYTLWRTTPDAVSVGCHFRDLMDVNRYNGLYAVEDRDWEAYVASRVAEISGGEVTPREFCRADGVTMIYSVVPLSGGKRLVSYCDISDIKQRETEAQEARLQLANVIESLPAGIVIYDRNDRFVLANRKVKETLPAMVEYMQPGVRLRDALRAAHAAGYFRLSGSEAIDDLYDADPEAWLDAYCARYHVRHAVFERQNADGRWFQVHDGRTADGTFVGVRVDITEIKQREAALKESMRENELFRNLIDNVPVAIYAKKPDLTLMYVNDGWCRLTGFTRQDAIGRTDFEIFGDDGRPFMDADRDVLRTGATVEVEEAARLADGSVRYQIAHKRSMTASDGSLYLIGSTTDVTELRRREDELKEARERAVLADRAKSEFLANMSHEIRTPMNGVLGMAELLARSELDPKQRTFTDIIVKSGNSLLTIINDILDFSKIDAGQLMLDPAPFALAEAIEDVATLISTRAKEKDLEMIVRVDPGLPERVAGDAGRLRQIVTNLMGNAVKFTERGYVLAEVSGSIEGDMVLLRVAVTDTGIGIPEDKLELVFEKFSQVDASSTRRHEGTGLGLAISSRLVDLMGGRMGATSREGEGSTFWFEIALPVAEATAKRRIAPVDVTGARILIVDDNAINRAILSEQMASWAFDACAATSGPEGLAVLEAAAAMGVAVDCVVLDYQMPGMSGAEVAEAIPRKPAIAATPVVLLTSVDQSLNQQRYRELAIDMQLTKPARSSALLDALVTSIQKRRWAEHGADDAAVPPAPAEAAIATPEPAARPARPLPAERDFDPHRIDVLIAEDNEVNQLVFTQILEETGLAFEIVSNGRLAVEAARSMTPRMILMDVSMPEMNGLEATAAIRAAERAGGERVPIVGVTAHALKGDRERCLEAGMDDYLSKPIKPQALVEKIDLWIARAAGPELSRAGTRS